MLSHLDAHNPKERIIAVKERKQGPEGEKKEEKRTYKLDR